MRVSINEKRKTVEIWLTGADQRDEACAARVGALVSKWHGKGRTPVIYRSGKAELEELTSALLLSNRDRAARLDVERQQMAKAHHRP